MSIQNTPSRQTRDIVGALPSLSAHSSASTSPASNGTDYDLGRAYRTFSVAGVLTGSTAATVALMGSVDGSNYYSLDTFAIDSTAPGLPALSTNAIPVTRVRLDITAWTTNAASTAAESVNAWVLPIDE